MGYGHGGVAVEQHLGHGEADDVAAPDHDGAFALDLHSGLVEHPDHALGRAGIHAVSLLPERGDVGRVEAVDVLLVRDGLDHAVFVDMFRHGELHEHAVDRVVGVEPGDHVEKLGLRGLFGQTDGGALIAHLLGVLAFGFHVRLARRVLTYENHGQMWCAAIGGRQFGHPVRYVLLDFLSKVFSTYYHRLVNDW